MMRKIWKDIKIKLNKDSEMNSDFIGWNYRFGAFICFNYTLE